MFCKYINCLCSTRFLLTVNILCSSILEVIKIYIHATGHHLMLCSPQAAVICIVTASDDLQEVPWVVSQFGHGKASHYSLFIPSLVAEEYIRFTSTVAHGSIYRD